MKKILTIALTLCLLVTALAGCRHMFCILSIDF